MKKRKTLKLSRETLGRLTEPGMRIAAGAPESPAFCDTDAVTTCPSQITNPDCDGAVMGRN